MPLATVRTAEAVMEVRATCSFSRCMAHFSMRLPLIENRPSGLAPVPAWLAPSEFLRHLKAHDRPVAPLLHRPYDGMDRPALPVLPSPAHAQGAALYRNAHHRRGAARRPRAVARLRSVRATGRAA